MNGHERQEDKGSVRGGETGNDDSAPSPTVTSRSNERAKEAEQDLYREDGGES